MSRVLSVICPPSCLDAQSPPSSRKGHGHPKMPTKRIGSLVLLLGLAIALVPVPAKAGNLTLLYEDLSTCSLPAGWSNTSAVGGCGYSFSETPPAPPIGTPSPPGCVAYTDASVCFPGDSTNDRLTTSTINAAGFEGVTLTVRYFLPNVTHNLSIEVQSTPGGTETFDVPEQNFWQTQDIDLGAHAGATDLTISFVSDDLGSGGYGAAIRSLEVIGSGATGNILVTSPANGTTYSDYPVVLEFVHTDGALDRLSSRVELFGSQLGALRAVSDTQASFQINSGLVEGNNLIRACLTDANFDVACDEITIDWVPHTGDLDGNGRVTVFDVVGTVSLVLSDGYAAVVDMDGNGSLNVLDVIQLIRLIVSCHPPSINVALGGLGSYDSTCAAGSENYPVDGTLGAPYAQTCNTAIPPNHWWEVDLGRRFQIEQIKLWNRVEPCCESRLANIKIEIYDGNTLVYTAPSSGVLSYTPNDPQLLVTIPAKTGDRIRVVKVGASCATIRLAPRSSATRRAAVFAHQQNSTPRTGMSASPSYRRSSG